MMSRKAIALYCVLSMAVSWGIQFIAIRVLGDLERAEAAPFLLAVMWSPTLVALAFILFHKPARKGVLWKPTLPAVPLAILAALVPAAVAFADVALFEALGWGRSGYFDFSAEGVTIDGGPWVLGAGAQAWPMFVANVVGTALLFSGTNLVATVGEEFAWRGFLQGHMIERFGVVGGIVVLGLFWSFWHLPSLLAGYNYPDYPVLGGFVLFPIALVASALFLGWLTLRARSFWPAAIAHASTNSIHEGVISNIQMTVPRLYEDLTTIGIEVAIGLVCLALLRAHRDRRSGEARAPLAPQPAE